MEVIIRYRGKEFVVNVDNDHCLDIITKVDYKKIDIKDGKILFRSK